MLHCGGSKNCEALHADAGAVRDWIHNGQVVQVKPESRAGGTAKPDHAAVAGFPRPGAGGGERPASR